MTTTARRLATCLSIIALIALIAGCTSAGGSGSPGGSASPSPAGGPVRDMFSGTLDCGFPEGLDETTVDQITTYTGPFECVLTASDSRASGMLSGVITMAELDLSGFHANKWFGRPADYSITNAGGSWRNEEDFGADVWDPTGELHSTGTSAFIGEGGYAGMRMRLLYAQGTSEQVPAYILMGWIEPTD